MPPTAITVFAAVLTVNLFFAIGVEGGVMGAVLALISILGFVLLLPSGSGRPRPAPRRRTRPTARHHAETPPSERKAA